LLRVAFCFASPFASRRLLLRVAFCFASPFASRRLLLRVAFCFASPFASRRLLLRVAFRFAKAFEEPDRSCDTRADDLSFAALIFKNGSLDDLFSDPILPHFPICRALFRRKDATMSRLFLPPLLAVVCAASLWGCGPSANLAAGKPWSKRNPGSRDLLADNPLRERADARRSSGQRAAAPEELALAKSRSQNSHLEKFDEETLELIEEELANTPPEERAQFYNDVISLQPAMVRQIIHTRRIVRQVGQDAPSSRLASPQDRQAERHPGGIQRVSGEEFVENRPPLEYDPLDNSPGREPGRDPGLGAVDPWQRQTGSPQPTGGWTNDPSQPPADLPFNQIPSISGTGHSAGYVPGESGGNPAGAGSGNAIYRQQKSPTNIQPPPGGAQSPVRNFRDAVSALPNAPRMHQNARVPNDYNPQVPPVPNYGQNGGDPFAAGNAPAVRTASSNPNQPLPGVASTLSLGDSFGQSSDASSTASSEPGTQSSQADLSRLITAMEAEIAGLRFANQTEPGQKTAFVQKHVYLRMLYLMSGQEARAVTAIPDIPPADQEFWQQTFWAMSNYFDTNAMPDSEYRATQTIAQLRTAIQKLQENARLELRNVAFCHKISSFGNFDRFPQDEFGPGQPVLVYAEVVNFKSKPTSLPQKPNEAFYQTQLKSSIEIHRLGPSGDLVERFDFEPTEDLCHNQRRDYFHSYEFTIPQRISLGPHVMTLTVEDQLNRKVATYRLNFMVK
jgi:hypothetical protein